MNSLLLGGLALLAMTSMVLGIACPPGYCNDLKCEPLTKDNCSYTVVEHGGYCGCCDACIHFLAEGEECPVVTYKGGPPPTTKCADGLNCCKETGKCVKPE